MVSAAAALPPAWDPDRARDRARALRRIRSEADARIAALVAAPAAALDGRLAELGSEWAVERLLQANAATLMVLGIALGATVDRRLLLLPAAVLSFFAQHAVQGWCSPIPVFRRLGVRTAREIERERYAIKALRGDFDAVAAPGTDDAHSQVRAVLEAVAR